MWLHTALLPREWLKQTIAVYHTVDWRDERLDPLLEEKEAPFALAQQM